MNLDSLTQSNGEWLRGTGPESDIVVSSRIRLARNLSSFPFTSRASAHQKSEIDQLLRDKIARLDVQPALEYVQLPGLPPLDRQLLVERQLISRELQKIHLAVRGLYGEGSRASGDFYQISNQVTLGKSETTILTEIREVIPQIIAYERQARNALTRENRQLLHDKVHRALGTLKSATMITSEE